MASSSTMELAVAKLESSGLGPEHIESLGLTIHDGGETEAIHPSFRNIPSMVFNYFHPITGKPLSARPKWPPYKRLRYLGSTLPVDAKGRSIRYSQEPNSGCCAYFPKTVDWAEVAADTNTSIIITEGELKAAKACDMGMACIALGGVWSFLGNQTATGFLPELELIDWVKRRVYVIYDSDIISNRNVVEALNALAHQLEMRGAIPYTVCLPSIGEVGKTGLDDYLVARPSMEEFTRYVLEHRQSLTLAQPLWDLNEEVILVRNPQLVVVRSSGDKIDPSSFKEVIFANRMMPEQKLKEDGTTSLKPVSVAASWLKWPLRSEASGIVYEPGLPRITDGGKWNDWDGWGTSPVKGSVEPYLKLLNHIFQGAPKEAVEWFLNWCAYPIQNPGAKMYTCVAIHGTKQGTGKSFLIYSLGRIYGKHFTEIDQNTLHSNFTGWAENKQLVLGDDVTGSDKREIADMLKGMITRRELRINKKFVPDYTVRDCVNYAFTSQQPDSFFLEGDDRRFFIHEVFAEAMEHSFYTGYEDWLDRQGGAQALHYWLLHRNLGGFDHRARAFDTPARQRMIDVGRSDLGLWCERLKEDADNMLKVGAAKLRSDLFTARELVSVYDPGNIHKVSANGMARTLRRAGFVHVNEGMSLRWSKGTDRFFAIRNIEKWTRAGSATLKLHLEKTK